MDTKPINNEKSLIEMLNSYNILITILFLFLFLVPTIYILNPKGFNKFLGYEIFITLPLLAIIIYFFREIMTFNKTPSSSWLNNFDFFKTKIGLGSLYFIMILFTFAGLFAILKFGGVFSVKPPENNIAMLINFAIITISLMIAGFVYIKNKNKDDEILIKISKPIQDLFELRIKYTLGFVVFILLIIALYSFNPYDIITTYGGPVFFVTLFVGMVITIMISVYQHYIANPLDVKLLTTETSFFKYILKGLYILGALSISAGLIYGLLNFLGVFEQDATKPPSWGKIMFNIIIFCGMLGIIYKLANAGGFLIKIHIIG